MIDSKDRRWHLAKTNEEVKLTEFELQLWRVFYGFVRWQEDCESCINNHDLNGNDLSILHIIRMQNRPKTAYDVMRLLNREDVYNTQYSIKKLEKLKFIKKAPGKNKKMTAYEVTELGIKDTDDYTAARRAILVDMFKKEKDIKLEETIETLTKLKAIYDEAGRIAASYKNTDKNNKND